MDFLQLARERQSVRHYAARPVEAEKVERILEAGRLAPTAANFQPQRFLVLSSEEGLARLGQAAGIHGAPLAILVCGLQDKAWTRPQDGHSMLDIDTSIAACHMMLQAWSEGVASCWITWFDPAILRREFALPDTVTPVHILALGYAQGPLQASSRHQQQRIPLADMVWREALPPKERPAE